MNFGKTFKTERERLNISRPCMAKQLGITASALWKIEAGLSTPKQSTIIKFCTFVGVPLAYVVIMSIEQEDFNYTIPRTIASDPVTLA